MRYVEPFYREENDNPVSFLLPFIGGALIGGLVAPAFTNKNPGYYYPSYPSYNGYPPYSNYPQYPYYY